MYLYSYFAFVSCYAVLCVSSIKLLQKKQQQQDGIKQIEERSSQLMSDQKETSAEHQPGTAT